MDANGARFRARERAVPKTDADDRARVRSHQAQPADHQIPSKRPGGRAHRVAITDGDPQPRKAPPPPARRRRSLKQAPRRSQRQEPPRQRQPPTSAGIVTRQPLAKAIVGWAPHGRGKQSCRAACRVRPASLLARVLHEERTVWARDRAIVAPLAFLIVSLPLVIRSGTRALPANLRAPGTSDARSFAVRYLPL